MQAGHPRNLPGWQQVMKRVYLSKEFHIVMGLYNITNGSYTCAELSYYHDPKRANECYRAILRSLGPTRDELTKCGFKVDSIPAIDKE